MQHTWRTIIPVLLGNTIYAIGVVLFVLPGQLVAGGTTGIALILNHYISIPVSAFVFIFNLLMFLIGAWILGKKFAVTTIISTFYYPLILSVLEHLLPQAAITQDILLNTVFAGCCIGIGIGLVVKAGASTGGMDIPPLILNRLFRIPVSLSMYAFDFMILLGQFAFSNTERLLYGIILLLIYTVLLEKILILGKQKIELRIISPKWSIIRDEILKEVDRGVTLLHGQTGYLNQECEIIFSIISSRELVHVERIVHQVDEQAFMIVTRVQEVQGHGFSSQKQYLSRPRNVNP